MAVRVAVTLGDPTGIGPEIILKALSRPCGDVIHQVHGPRRLFEELAARLDLPWPGTGVEWLEGSALDLSLVPGQPHPLAGELQVKSLEAALTAVLAGRADALCTAPITKAAARQAGFAFPGHTEYLAQRCGATRVAMMLAGPSLRVVPMTGHVPLREVATRLTAEVIADVIVVTVSALIGDFGLERPRLALAALNPHAGEQGLMGDEEGRLFLPGRELAEAELRRVGLSATISGPWPADALFARHEAHDAILCGYHDQAMIPLKMLHRDDGVNVTLGLPIVRTSPAHGSALDIAGRGQADPSSMIAALRLAGELAARRRAAR